MRGENDEHQERPGGVRSKPAAEGRRAGAQIANSSLTAWSLAL
jgi:hypothetical protein